MSRRRRPPRWLAQLLGLDYVVTVALFVVLVTVTFLGVVMRYFVNMPFVWLEELQLALFLGVVYLGAGAAFRAGSHVAIDFVVDRFPAGLRRVVEVLISVVLVVVLAFYFWHGLGMVGGLLESGRTTNVLKIPSALIYSVLPIGAVLIVVNYFFTLFYVPLEEEEEALDA